MKKRILNFCKKNSRIILIVWIFLLAFSFRAFHLSAFISYHQDQVRDLIFIKDHFDKGLPILLGPKASVGNFYLPPFWYYLMSLAFVFSTSPVAPAFIVTLLSSLTVILIYLFSEKYFDKKTAFFASLLYAISPLSIEYSRFAWNPNPVPFFTMASFYFLYIYLYDQRNYGFWLGLVMANLCLQLHYQGMIVFTFFFLAILMTKKLSWKKFFQFIIINFILFLPFFIHEYTNNFENTKGIINFLFKTQSSSSLRFYGIPFFIKFIFRDFSTFIGEVLFFKNFILGLIGLLIFGISILYPKEKSPPIKTLKYFFIFSFIMFFFYKNSLINFYLLFIIPILIIYLTNIIIKLLNENVFVVIFLIIISLNIFLSPTFGKADNTYLAIRQGVESITQKNNYCLSYRIYTPTFIESKYRYLVSLVKKQPLDINCEIPLFYRCDPKVKNLFLVCAGGLCDHPYINYQFATLVRQPEGISGVKIYNIRQ